MSDSAKKAPEASYKRDDAQMYDSRGDLLAALTPPLVDKLNVSEDQIVESANFKDDLDADSLDIVEILMLIDEDFGVHIVDEDAEKLKTVGDALDYLVPFLVG